MSTTTFKAGDEVYNIEGHAASYVARSAGGHIVEPIYEHEEDEGAVSFGEAVTWREVFTKPPVEKLHADTEVALQKLIEAQRKLDETRQAQYAFEREEKARMERLKQHEALANLDRYIKGEFTHYVAMREHGETVAIIPVADTLDGYSDNRGYGLLTLSPVKDWGGALQWRVSYKEKGARYGYDSRDDRVIPCCGEEEARAVARQVMTDFAAKMVATPIKQRYQPRVEILIACCEKFGADVPQELRDGVEQSKLRDAERNLAKATEAMQEAQRALAALKPAEAAP